MRSCSKDTMRGFVKRAWCNEGLSLIEVLVALLLLGVILSASAASIITFTREGSASERRVQATAAMTRLHEDFQSIPFALTFNYDVDLLELAAVSDVEGFEGIDVLSTPPSFESRPIRSVPVLGDRDPRVPVAYQIGRLNEVLDPDEEPEDTSGELGERDVYEVVQVVTEIDRSGDGLEEVRRLTTFVAWEWLGRRYVQRMDSERAITSFDPSEAPESRGFLISPLRVVLAADSTLPEDLSLIASFTAPVDQAHVHFERLDLDGGGNIVVVEDEVQLNGTLAEAGGFVRFTGEIPTTATDGSPIRFDTSGGDPLVTLRLVGKSVGFPDDVEAVANVRLAVGGTQDVAVTAANASPSPVAINDLGLLCPITVTAQVQGMRAEDYGVQATWTAGPEQRTIALEPVNGESSLTGGTDPFSGTLGAGDSHGLSVGDKVRFTVRAEGQDGQDDVRETAEEISIVAEGSGC